MAKTLNVEDHSGFRITGVGTPTATTDATTKAYVDASTKARVRIKLCSADFTPSAVGIDKGGLSVVPKVDGASVNFTVSDIFFRVEVAGSTASTVRIQRSTAATAFVNAGYLDTAGTTVAASGFEASGAALSVTTVASGDKLMPEYTALGTGATGFTVYIYLKQQ